MQNKDINLFTIRNLSFYLDVSLQDLSPDTLSAQLRSAVKNNDRSTLERLIPVAEKAQYPELGFDLREARDALQKLGGGYGG